MNKKHIIVLLVIFVIAIGLVFAIAKLGNIKDQETISNIKKDSYLDIIVNLGDYSPTSYDEERLLDVAMQLAENLGLLNESNEDDNYVQYVNANDVHSIIYELTGNVVEAPIEIEDFYYLYDSEHEYYFYRPASPTYFQVKEISSIKENGTTYNILCSIAKTEDYEEINLNNVKVKLTYTPENALIKYKVDKIEIHK